LGPGPIKPELRGEYFELLGVPPLPEKGDYYITFDAFTRPAAAGSHRVAHEAAAQEELEKEYCAAYTRPWSKEEFPRLAEWLAANEKPMALAVEATKCARWFDPLVPEGRGMLLSVSRERVSQYREVARGLLVRAMLRLDEGRAEEAWTDILACHRLARLVGQTGFLIDALVGITFDGMACAGDQALLQNAPLSAVQAMRMHDELSNLPPMPKMVEAIDGPERYMYLDSVAGVAREGISAISGLSGGSLDTHVPKNPLESLLDTSASSAIDWDLILRMGNGWYDRAVDALRKPTRAERRRAAAEATKDIEGQMKEAAGWKSIVMAALFDRRGGVSRRIGLVILALMLPATGSACEAEDRVAMQFEVTGLGFALAAYRADHGAFPARLADLVPKYAAEVPKDVFADADLRYKLEGSGCLVYSVGINGKDDGGKGYADRKDGEDWDDLAIRVPAPPRGKKQ
jgi:hypothetical protein